MYHKSYKVNEILPNTTNQSNDFFGLMIEINEKLI